MEILLNFGLGLLGILFFTLFKSKDYIFAQEFVLPTFVNENVKGWVWSLLVILAVAITINVAPGTAVLIKEMFAIDLVASPTGFFVFGVGINVLLKKPSARAKAAKARGKAKTLEAKTLQG